MGMVKHIYTFYYSLFKHGPISLSQHRGLFSYPDLPSAKKRSGYENTVGLNARNNIPQTKIYLIDMHIDFIPT